MGIRFLCPNGHKLNVKAFLAGKRGICPQCDAKFLVPSESGGQAPQIEETPIEELPAAALAEPVVSAPPVATPVAEAPPIVGEPRPPDVWYVRTPAGDQFGPASLQVMQSWVAEGRVAVDCWVWRTGWPEWKTGGQAITSLNGPPIDVTMPDVTMPDVTSADVTLPEVGRPLTESADAPQEVLPEELPETSLATIHYRSAKRSRQERARKVTIFLCGVVVLLVAVLVAVLFKNSR